MFGRKEINVNIVTGDINNSEITFVRITDPDGWERQFESKSLFTTIFTEFLGLPSLQELEWQSKVRSAIRKGRIKEYRKVFDLWRDASMGGMRGRGEPLSKGSFIRLSDIQLTEFVNRNPGYCYTG